MISPTRISAEDTYKALRSDSHARLICIYPHENWEKSHLDGSISLATLEAQLIKLPINSSLIFY